MLIIAEDRDSARLRAFAETGRDGTTFDILQSIDTKSAFHIYSGASAARFSPL